MECDFILLLTEPYYYFKNVEAFLLEVVLFLGTVVLDQE